MNSTFLLPILGLLATTLSLALIVVYTHLRRLRSHYQSVTDAEAEALRLRTEAQRDADTVKAASTAEVDRLRREIEEEKKKRAGLYAENASAAATRDRLQKEVSLLEESLENISFGLYKPHFDYDTPEAYKVALEELAGKQREMIRAGAATHFQVQWTVGGSRQDGERMQRQYSKLLLRAFNGECEAAIARVSWNNIGQMQERIRHAFDAINRLGGVMKVSVVEPYMNLKLTELRLEHEMEEKKHSVAAEERRAREQMREEERAQRELDAEKAEAEEEEERFAKALEKARIDMARAKGEEHERLTSRILELEEQLRGARQKKERVSALASLTKAGYVYVLSNIGSFGPDVLKIGLTRRFEPTERVKELSDASVPFGFDVHAMVYDEDAPALESRLQTRFADRSVNPINPRKEFFRVSIDELEAFVKEQGLKIAFTRVPEAREYRETMALRRGVEPEGAPRSVEIHADTSVLGDGRPSQGTWHPSGTEAGVSLSASQN